VNRATYPVSADVAHRQTLSERRPGQRRLRRRE
jgi:hypothetical protein